MNLKNTILVSIAVHFILLHAGWLILLGWIFLASLAIYWNIRYLNPDDRLSQLLYSCLAAILPPMALCLIFLFDRKTIQNDWVYIKLKKFFLGNNQPSV